MTQTQNVWHFPKKLYKVKLRDESEHVPENDQVKMFRFYFLFSFNLKHYGFYSYLVIEKWIQIK